MQAELSKQRYATDHRAKGKVSVASMYNSLIVINLFFMKQKGDFVEEREGESRIAARHGPLLAPRRNIDGLPQMSLGTF